MPSNYVIACLLCGRLLGHIIGGRLRSRTSRPVHRRAGRALRCGYCAGSVVLEVDDSLDPPDWLAEMERELAQGA